MTDAKCAINHRHQADEGWTVCRGCLARLDGNLERIAEIVSHASAWLVAPRTSAGGGTRTVPGSKPPLDLDTLDAALATDVLPVLDSWERLTREFYGMTPYGPASAARNAHNAHGGPITPPATVKGCTGFLRAQLARIAETPDYPIDDLAREIRELRVRLDHLDPDHERPDGIRVPCPAPHPDSDGRSCDNRITVNMQRPADDIVCRRCGVTWTSGRLMLNALSDPRVSVWAYPADISDALGVNPTTLRQWFKRGQIKRNGNRYDVGQAFRLHHGGAA